MKENIHNHIYDKWLISKKCKEFTQFNSKDNNNNNTSKEWAEKLINIFPNKAYKWPTGTQKLLTSQVIRK